MPQRFAERSSVSSRDIHIFNIQHILEWINVNARVDSQSLRMSSAALAIMLASLYSGEVI